MRLTRFAAAVLAGAALAVAVLVTVAPAALATTSARTVFAHAALASTQPADGSVVSTAPQQVTASFDQPVGLVTGSLVVYSPTGQRVDNGQVTHLTTYEIAVGLLPNLGDGTYTAVWHVISADTHPVEGAFTFSVGAPSATHVSALAASSSDPLVSDLFTVDRWLEYLCFALLGGGVAFLIFCWPEGGSSKRVGRLVTASALGLLVTTLLGLLLQGPYEAGTGLSQLFNGTLVKTTLQGHLGPASEAREIMCLLAAGLASYLLPRLPSATRRFRQAAGVHWAILVSALAGSWAVYDHASTGVQTPWGIPGDIVHLDAVALWIGGLAVLCGFALRRPELDQPSLARAVPRFSRIALGCVIAIIASGVYQTWREVGAWDALFDTTYGRLILAKIAGLLVLIALGYLARGLIQRGLAPALAGATLVTVPSSPGPGDGLSSGAGSGPGPGWAPAMRRLRRSVAAELAVALVILALTAVLVNTATGREAYAPTVTASQPFNTGGPGGSGIVHVFAEPATLGPNTIQVYFTTASGGKFVPAQVTAALYFPAKDLGPEPVTLTRTAPGQYKAESATVTFTGQWTLQIIVRSDAFDETSVTFTLAIH